jgi:uncharacterized protein
MNRIALFLAACLVALTAGAADVPYLSGRVVDNAELLGAGTKRRLDERLKAHEAETGNQIVVLTVPSLGGESVEAYAEQVFNAWKLGQKGRDNGVLVLVAPEERRMRIEVGYGLEGTLTDVAASRIIRNVMTPRFKEGDFEAGIEQGVAAVIGLLTGTAAAPADPPAGRAEPPERASDGFFEDPDLSLPERILIGAFIFGIIGLFTVIGIVTPGAGWFLYFFLIPFWAVFPMVVVGTTGALYLFGAYLLGFPVVKLIVSRRPWYEKAQRDLRSKGTARIGGFTLGGASGGSSWRSGSSGGGFSGGGGRSGGGGASGSW